MRRSVLFFCLLGLCFDLIATKKITLEVPIGVVVEGKSFKQKMVADSTFESSRTHIEILFNPKEITVEGISSIHPGFESKDVKYTLHADRLVFDYSGALVHLDKNPTLFEVRARTKANGKKDFLSFSPASFVKSPDKYTFISKEIKSKKAPFFSRDVLVFGILFLCLALVFYTSSLKNRAFKKFYTVVPALLMCYLLPSILNSFNIISSDLSNLYTMAKNYLLPASLILMTLSIDLKGLVGLGWKPVAMFLTGTLGIIIGGPLAILLISIFWPEVVGGAGPDAVWRGLATLAGSWIGGGANQAAMLEVYGYNQEKYGAMVLVDIVVANIWMAVLLFGIGKKAKIDRFLKADSSAIDHLEKKVAQYSATVTKTPTLGNVMVLGGVAFFGVAVSHYFAIFIGGHITDYYLGLKASVEAPSAGMRIWLSALESFKSSFFWMVAIVTALGLILSVTPMRRLEGYGASRIGSLFIYLLVATIGMKMDIAAIFQKENLGLFAVGIVWMLIHVVLLGIVARMIKAPYFFLAVGSKANVGGAASAPVVAAAFSPSLAPVGVILAVFGYAVGTYGAMLCAILMQMVAPA